MKEMPPGALGKELILDLFECEFFMLQKQALDEFFVQLCNLIDMERTKLFYWEYDGTVEHLKGLSAVQFIKTSNITVHTFDNERKVSINLYSCKDFNEIEAEMFIQNYFKGLVNASTTIIRY